MKKDEILEVIKEIFETKTKKEADEILAKIDSVVEVIGDKLDVKKKATLGKFISIEKKFVEAKPAKDGEITQVINGEKIKKPYHTEAKPAHNEVKIKATKQLNK